MRKLGSVEGTPGFQESLDDPVQDLAQNDLFATIHRIPVGSVSECLY